MSEKSEFGDVYGILRDEVGLDTAEVDKYFAISLQNGEFVLRLRDHAWLEGTTYAAMQKLVKKTGGSYVAKPPTFTIPEHESEKSASAEAEEESPYNLAASRDGLGELSPVLKDAYGNVIDGFHRIGENPNWHSITVAHIDNPVKLELARLAVNFARRKVTPEELTQRITFLVKSGLKPKEIARRTGISERAIYKYTPQELKSQEMVDAARKAEHLAARVQLDKRKDSDAHDQFVEALHSAGREAKPSKPLDHESIGANCPICGCGVSRDKFERLKKKFQEMYPGLFAEAEVQKMMGTKLNSIQVNEGKM